MAERWTVAQLEQAIDVQLVGKYMRAVSSNYGILLLASSGKPKVWEHESGRLGFAKLVKHLRSYAQHVLRCTPTILDIAVLPLDFH